MSGKRKPDVRGLLLEGNFGVSRDLPVSDPLTTTQMVLEIHRIKPYDRNPRREINPRYADIKESIRAQGGLNNPLTITRRPGDESFMVEAGGNTRLAILQELWRETADPRFQRIHCLFVPWRSESHVLGAHLIENELRGDMLLIDKALAVRELQKLLESENDTPLNQSELQRQLTGLGYKISRRQLSRYLYAADVLAPLVPKALRTGLGRYHVDHLRAIDGAYRRLFDGLSVPKPEYQTWFPATLAALDREDLALEAICSALEQSFATISGLSPRQVSHQLAALLKGAAKHDDEESADPDGISSRSTFEAAVPVDEPPAIPRGGASTGSPSGLAGAPLQNRSPDSATRSKRTEEIGPASHRDLPDSPAEGASGNRLTISDQSAPIATSTPTANGFETKPIESPERIPESTNLDTWRTQACELAGQVAAALGFGGAIQTWNGGYGFTLDLPEQALADDQAWAGWWLLLGISEQAVSADRLALMPKEHPLAGHLLRQGEDALQARTGSPPAIVLLPFHLFQSRQLSDQIFDNLWRLIATCRAMRRHFRESDLWDCLTVEQSRLRARMIELGEHHDG